MTAEITPFPGKNAARGRLDPPEYAARAEMIIRESCQTTGRGDVMDAAIAEAIAEDRAMWAGVIRDLAEKAMNRGDSNQACMLAAIAEKMSPEQPQPPRGAA